MVNLLWSSSATKKRRDRWSAGVVSDRLRSGPFEGPAIVMPPALPEDIYLCAEHVRQLRGESPLYNLMEVK